MNAPLFAAAFLISGTAFAPAPIKPEAPATSPVVSPDNSSPRVDSNGITVVSALAQVPQGFNRAPGMNGVAGNPYVDPSRPPAPQPATMNYLLCSRAVTDHCVENYELGSASPHRRHHRRR